MEEEKLQYAFLDPFFMSFVVCNFRKLILKD